MSKIQINFSDEQMNWLRDESVRTGHSMSTIVRLALNDYVKERVKE